MQGDEGGKKVIFMFRTSWKVIMINAGQKVGTRDIALQVVLLKMFCCLYANIYAYMFTFKDVL